MALSTLTAAAAPHFSCSYHTARLHFDRDTRCCAVFLCLIVVERQRSGKCTARFDVAFFCPFRTARRDEHVAISVLFSHCCLRSRLLFSFHVYFRVWWCHWRRNLARECSSVVPLGPKWWFFVAFSISGCLEALQPLYWKADVPTCGTQQSTTGNHLTLLIDCSYEWIERYVPIVFF